MGRLHAPVGAFVANAADNSIRVIDTTTQAGTMTSIGLPLRPYALAWVTYGVSSQPEFGRGNRNRPGTATRNADQGASSAMPHCKTR